MYTNGAKNHNVYKSVILVIIITKCFKEYTNQDELNLYTDISCVTIE